MEIEDLDVEIRIIEKKVEMQRENLEKFVRDFIEAAKIFSKEWIINTFKSSVKKEYEITISMEKEKLHLLKSKCRNLMLEIPQNIGMVFDTAEYWEHRKISHPNEIDSHPRIIRDYEFKEVIDKPLIRILGLVCELLYEFGYIKNSEDSIWYQSDKGLMHNKTIAWSQDMETIAKKYIYSYAQFYSLNQEINLLITKKEKKEAKNLWDEA